MPIFVALIGGAAALGGSMIQSSAASKAAKAGQKAAADNKKLGQEYQTASLGDLDKALGQAVGTLDQGAKDASAPLDPYRQAGESSLSQIMGLLGLNGADASKSALSNFTTSADYNFRVGEGQQALERSQNAGGNRFSGAAGKALVDYGQQAGSQEYGNYFSRLTGVANNGQNAATNISNIAGSAATSKANAMLGTAQNKGNVRLGTLSALTGANNQNANATGAGINGAANAWSGGLNSISGIAGNYAGSLSGSVPRSNAAGISGIPWSANQAWQV